MMKREDKVMALKRELQDYLSSEMYVSIRFGSGLPGDEFYVARGVYMAFCILAKMGGHKEIRLHVSESQRLRFISNAISGIFLFLRTLTISVKCHSPIRICGKHHWTIEMDNCTWHLFIRRHHCLSPYPPGDSGRYVIPISGVHFIKHLSIVDSIMPWFLEAIAQTRKDVQKEWMICRLKDAAKGLK